MVKIPCGIHSHAPGPDGIAHETYHPVRAALAHLSDGAMTVIGDVEIRLRINSDPLGHRKWRVASDGTDIPTGFCMGEHPDREICAVRDIDVSCGIGRQVLRI